MTVHNSSLTLVIIYRPPPSSKNKIPRHQFLNDFSDLLESVAIISGNPIIVGDFNIHCEDLGSQETIKFNQILTDFNLTQHIAEATHELGHILDCVISRKHDDFIKDISIGQLGSDHFFIIANHQYKRRKYLTAS